MADLPKPGSETKRDRVLSDVEIVSVWDGAIKLGWPFGDAIRLLMLTGARRDEIGALRWKEIGDDQIITLEGFRTKNGQPHSIPLSTPAISILEKVFRPVAIFSQKAPWRPRRLWKRRKRI